MFHSSRLGQQHEGGGSGDDGTPKHGELGHSLLETPVGPEPQVRVAQLLPLLPSARAGQGLHALLGACACLSVARASIKTRYTRAVTPATVLSRWAQVLHPSPSHVGRTELTLIEERHLSDHRAHAIEDPGEPVGKTTCRLCCSPAEWHSLSRLRPHTCLFASWFWHVGQETASWY